MSEAFAQVAEQMIADKTGGDAQSPSPSPDASNNIDSQGSSTRQDAATTQKIAELIELDKLEKFKYQGQEWSRKDLESAILRQQDYTKKTMSLSDERKAFEADKKYERALGFDLQVVAQDRSRIQEFLQKYPAKYHEELENYLAAYDAQQSRSQPNQQNQQQQPHVDVNFLSEFQQMKQFFQEQQIQKNTVALDGMVAGALKKYPGAERVMELAYGRLYDAHNGGQAVTQELVDQVFEQAQKVLKEATKAEYGDLVRKQTEANKVARADKAGGGVPGQAPKKFSKFKDITEHAVSDLKGRA